MGAFVKGTPETVLNLVELMLIVSGKFECVHDGSKSDDFKKAEEHTFFTRVYQLKSNPKITYHFRYDLRTGWADAQVSWDNMPELKKELEKAVGNMGKTES